MTGTVLVADDHPLFRQALRLAVEKILPEASIVEAGTLATAVAAATAAPDLRLILLDLKMPGA
ncbi:MAG: DNA-binding response regulator, partial [Sphingopyxis sp.]